jgi:hypothetical protein
MGHENNRKMSTEFFGAFVNHQRLMSAGRRARGNRRPLTCLHGCSFEGPTGDNTIASPPTAD